MNESEQQETKIIDLILIAAEVKPQKDGGSLVRFGSQMSEELLIQICKEDQESWDLIKKVIFDSLDKIETACGYRLNDEGTEVVRPEE